MLRKLRKAGVSESACAWFESYLSQRQQVVKFQNTVSAPLSVRVANHLAMWMTPNSSLGSPPANLTTSSLQ